VSLKDVLTLVAAFLAPTLAAAVALASNLGRRQRLKLAVEIKGAIDESQVSDWNRMIRRDTAAVIRSSRSHWVVWSIYMVGAAVALAPALVTALLPYRREFERSGLVLVVLSFVLALRFRLGRRKETQKESSEIAKMRAEIESQKSEQEVLKGLLEHLKERGSVGLEFASRTAYDIGAPMQVVRRIRLLDEDFKFAHLLVDRDNFRWKVRRVTRRFSAARKQYGTVGQDLPDELKRLLQRQPL